MKYFSWIDKSILKATWRYYALKIAPRGLQVRIELTNNLTYILRGRQADKTVFKEIWLTSLYDQYGVKVEKGDTVVDIGAHVGIFSTYAAELSKTGTIFSFEPFKENFERLNFHKTLNHKANMVTFNLGIAGDSGKKVFHINEKNSGGNSLFKGKNKTKKIEINTIRLSDFCTQENIKRIDFLKIDCEGAEYDILEQAPSFLNFTQKIIMETHPYQGKSVFRLIEILKSNGFRIHNESEIVSDQTLNMVYASKA